MCFRIWISVKVHAPRYPVDLYFPPSLTFKCTHHCMIIFINKYNFKDLKNTGSYLSSYSVHWNTTPQEHFKTNRRFIWSSPMAIGALDNLRHRWGGAYGMAWHKGPALLLFIRTLLEIGNFLYLVCSTLIFTLGNFGF